MTPRTALSAAVLATGLLVSLPVRGLADESARQEELRRKAMEMMGPGPEHVRLTNLRGHWDVEVRTWPSPGADPVVSAGRAVNTAVLGGRFLQSTWTASIMGMEVENLTMLGFDRRNGRYTAIVFDTFGTYSVSASGHHDAATGAIRLRGEESESSLGDSHRFSFVLELIDAGHYTWSLHFHDSPASSGAADFKMMEIRFSKPADATNAPGEGR